MQIRVQSPTHDLAPTLGTLVRAWSDRGEPPPVAVVVSIFDDVLALPLDGSDVALELDDIRIDEGGQATLARDADLDAIAPLLAQALGQSEGSAPPSALSLLKRLQSEDPHERPSDPEQLRQWLRSGLGPPASREEVWACVTTDAGSASAETSEIHEAETLPPEQGKLPIPVAVEDTESDAPAPASDQALIETDIIRTRAIPKEQIPEEDQHPTVPEAVVEVATPLLESEPAHAPDTWIDPPRDSQNPTEVDGDFGERPIVRHKTEPRRPVSLIAAPAARRSAKPFGRGHDSILMPAESRMGWLWVLLIGCVVGGAYWFFGG